MEEIEKLLDIVRRLREPENGCPWDCRQDFASLAPFTLEEAYEVVDAIRRDDLEGLRDELGDLLFQVVFHSRVAEESGTFNFGDVANGISEKLRRRHPHVFGTEAERKAGAVEGSWERIKADERRQRGEHDEATSALDGVARSLPALMRAQKIGQRAARIGFDWPDEAGPADKVAEELLELQEALERGNETDAAEELGDLLFAAASLARHIGADAEDVLDAANRKFERRFREMEDQFRRRGIEMGDLDIDALEKEWQAVKRR